METQKTYTKLKKISEKNGDIEFRAEVPAELLEQYVLHSLAAFAEDFALPGFRKGKVPHEKVREHIGEMELLEDAANDALRDAMAEIAEDEALAVLGRPQVTITKIAPKNPMEFTVKFALSPEVSLPDYKKIAKQIFDRKDPTDVSEKEIDEALNRIRKMIASATGDAAAEKDKDAPLPPLTDEDVKKFGNFNTVADFRAELKRQLEQEKMLHMKDGRREEVIHAIVEHAKLKVPALLVDQEFDDFAENRDRRLKDAGIALDEYLKQVGKTADQLAAEERKLIEDELRMSLVVQAIRKQEDITADDRDVHSLMAQLKLRYPERTDAELHRTAEAMIVQNKMFALLEGISVPELRTAEAVKDAAAEKDF